MRRLDSADEGFAAAFAALVADEREATADVGGVVAAIIADVRARGDEALAEYTKRFDGLDLATTPLRLSRAEVAEGARDTPADVREALTQAATRIEAFHARQRPDDARFTDQTGATLGWRYTPLAAAGLYVPGGRAAYPSSLLMNAIPAKVAGVGRVVMTVPAREGHIAPAVLAAAEIAGVDEVFRVGGAQAIAALAYGTRTIAAVDKIVGPGNAFVAEAKRQVFGAVGIDMVAGPSEVVIVADDGASAELVAADLLAQAEHDEVAQSILITDSAALAEAVAAAVKGQLADLPRREIAQASWERHGAIITVASLPDAVPLVDRLAPEHLQIAVADPEALFAAVRNAGSVFLGYDTPEAIGDYVAGPNHVLPTGRAARYASGLSVADFVKRSTFLSTPREALRTLAEPAMRLAHAEGLDAHRLSIARRLNAPPAVSDG